MALLTFPCIENVGTILEIVCGPPLDQRTHGRPYDCGVRMVKARERRRGFMRTMEDGRTLYYCRLYLLTWTWQLGHGKSRPTAPQFFF
jgi:hypothetical protein